MHTNSIDKEEEYSLQLVVRVLNINSDSKADILKKCPILNEYAQFVECVRKHKKMGEKDAYRRNNKCNIVKINTEIKFQCLDMDVCDLQKRVESSILIRLSRK